MTSSRRRIVLSIALAAVAALVAAAPAAARETRVTVPTPAGPGPAQYNQVFVDKYGPAKAKRVLVLMPGTSGGSGNFTLAARYIVKHVPDLQVWSIDRRSQALEERGVFEQALKGQVSLQYMFDYYLGWLDGGGPTDHFDFLRGPEDFPFVRDWGMKVALDDARAVVLQARAKGKRKVVLGGHSLGASLTAAYASWDFNGTPGYKDIDGMVLIDGGLLGSFDPFTLAEAQAGGRHPVGGDAVLGPPRHRHPRGRRALRRDRRDQRAQGPDRLGGGRPGVCSAAAGVQPALPRHQPRPPRQRVRPRHLADRAVAAAHQQRQPRDVGSAARFHPRRDHAGRAPRGRRSARSPPTASSGTSRAS